MDTNIDSNSNIGDALYDGITYRQGRFLLICLQTA
jgi:hypothetical protein